MNRFPAMNRWAEKQNGLRAFGWEVEAVLPEPKDMACPEGHSGFDERVPSAYALGYQLAPFGLGAMACVGNRVVTRSNRKILRLRIRIAVRILRSG
jgi:hypothetical protein